MKKRALIVLDVQKAMVERGDFADRIGNIETLIRLFERNKDPVIFFMHTDLDNPLNPLYYEKEDNISIVLDTGACEVFVKNKPNAFCNAQFSEYLRKSGIEQLVITGFNIEYCCMFTAIAAEHEGYEAILIEDACGTVNNAETYEMPGLDIYDFIGTVLNWSGSVNVLYLGEYLEGIGRQ